MRAGVKEGTQKGKSKQFRVVDLDDPEEQPITNSSGDPVDGGGHRVEGISQRLADDINESLAKRGK